MDNLLLNSSTRSQLEAYLRQPTQTLIISGPAGSGKATISRYLVKSTLQIDDLDNYPYVRQLAPSDKKSTGIEAIRDLEQFLSLKVPGDSAYDRAVIIDQAEALTIEAQNALLKTLEEPPTGSLLILNSGSDQALLPTIRSRAQIITVSRPDKQQALDHFAKFDSKTVEQAYAISGGLPGLMSALLNDESHPLLEATKRARQLLSQSSFERLATVDELAKNKQLASDISFILQQMAHVSLLSAQGSAAERWQRVLQISYETSETLAGNTQPKLALDHMMLNL